VQDAPSHATRLFIIKGRRFIRPRQVECTHKSLNDGDAFVLDAPKTVFVWYGRNANKIERGAAAKFGTDYKNETRKGAVNVVYIGASFGFYCKNIKSPVEYNTVPSIQKTFWEALGGEGEVATEEQGGNDIVVENAVKSSLVLNKFVLNGADVQMSRVNEGGAELSKDMVEYGSASVLVLDCTTEAKQLFKLSLLKMFVSDIRLGRQGRDQGPSRLGQGICDYCSQEPACVDPVAHVQGEPRNVAVPSQVFRLARGRQGGRNQEACRWYLENFVHASNLFSQ